MEKCEFKSEDDCQFPHKCRSIGCGKMGFEPRHYRTDKAPWQTVCKAEPEIPCDPVIERVRSDLLRRQQLGYRKYGGTLATNPAGLRGALQHAYEEALDLCNYLQWAMMQLDKSPELQPDETHNTGLKEDAGEDR